MQPTEIREEGGPDRGAGGLARMGTGSPGGKESRGFSWQFLTCRHLPHKTPESKADPPPISVGKVRPKRARGATGAENHGRGPCVSCRILATPADASQHQISYFRDTASWSIPFQLSQVCQVTRGTAPLQAGQNRMCRSHTHTHPRQRVLCLLSAFPSFQFCLPP